MANIDLLQHEIERFGVVTVMDVTLYDVISGAPVLFLDTLKISNITAEGQEKTITGGKYADLLLTYNFGRSLNLEFQDALLSPASMRQLWGANKAATTNAHGYEVLKLGAVTSGVGAVTLLKDDATVLGVTNLTTGEVYKAKAGTTAVAGEWVNVDGTITLTGDATPVLGEPWFLTANDDIRVDYTYIVAAGDSVSEMVLTSSSFPKTVKLVGKTFVLNQINGQQVDLEIEVPKLKLASNFTMTLDAEGDASVFDFSGMALVNGADKELIKIKTLGYSVV